MRAATPSLRPNAARLRGWQIATLIFLGLATVTAGYAAYRRAATPAQVGFTTQPFPVQRGTIQSSVSTTGSVVAGTASKLAFDVTGSLAQVLVKVGHSVEKGQPLAKLETTSLNLKLDQARAQVSSAETGLALVQQGPRPEEVAAAEASLASAKAKLADLQAGPTAADLQAAQATVTGAKSNLAAAQAKLATLQAQPDPNDVKVAQNELDAAKLSLAAAQTSRNGICGMGDKTSACYGADASVAQAWTAVDSAAANLEKVSQPASAGDLTAAQEAVASAQAAYDSALANLKRVQAGSTAAEIAAAQAAVSSAQSQLVMKRAPYTDADLKGAQAALEQARATLATAQRQLDSATLLAPFAGVVSAAAMNPGESASGATITMVDPKALRIDATVDESDIGKLALGQTATITFDAISGRTFQGKVVAIAPSGTVSSGVVTYLVSLSIESPEGLKAGMTANANIVTSSKENVLLVPNRALQAQGRSRVVNVLVDGKSQTRPVQVGLSNDQFTEVTEGLDDGDQVLINATTTTAPRVNTGSMMTGGGPPPGDMGSGGFGGPPPGGMGR